MISLGLQVEFFEGWKPLSPLQLAVEENPQPCMLTIMNLLNHPIDYDLMPIELSNVDAIIGMDWLTKYYAVIVCDEKLVYSEVSTDRMPEVFPEDIPGLQTTRQGKFKIDLPPSVASMARSPDRLAPSEIKELSNQLQELSDKGFIRPSSYLEELQSCLLKRMDPSICSLRVPSDAFGLTNAPTIFMDLMNRVNVVVDALIRKERINTLRARALVMTINLNLPSQILNAQVKEMREENVKEENFCGTDKEFETRPMELSILGIGVGYHALET
ncbi:hypothetical protein Tco_1125077 [Tanacetum coccineum]|uniref:Reverse transcriptase domain-containing protein n=1 Tax=Tanacetum coccineum TaxID=301880 RepID=A0ABQ5J7Z6_9ASTR